MVQPRGESDGLVETESTEESRLESESIAMGEGGEEESEVELEGGGVVSSEDEPWLFGSGDRL